MKLLNGLKCKFGFHDFKAEKMDTKFLPNVLILVGQCSRCPEFDNFVFFYDSGKVVSKNHGLDRLLFGDFTVMPMTEEDYELRDKYLRRTEK